MKKSELVAFCEDYSVEVRDGKVNVTQLERVLAAWKWCGKCVRMTDHDENGDCKDHNVDAPKDEGRAAAKEKTQEDYDKYERQTKEQTHLKEFGKKVKYQDLFKDLQKNYGNGARPRVEQYHNGVRIYTDFYSDSKDDESDYKSDFTALMPKVLELVKKSFKDATVNKWFEGSYQNMEFEFDLP